ncbi:unnamed protein product, partial [Owenia fusiformis]
MELSNLASVEQTQNAASTNDITQKTNGSSPGSSARPLTASSGQQSGSVTPSNVLVNPLAKNNQKKLMPIRGSPGGNTSLERVTRSSDILDQESTLAILEGDNVDSTSHEMLIIPEKVQEFGALRSSTIDDYTETRHLLQGGRNRVRKRRNISNRPTGQVLAGSTTARSTESPQVTRRSSRNNSRSNSLTGLSNGNLNSARYTNGDVEKGQIPKSRTEDVKLSQAEYIKQHFPLKKCTRFVKKKNEDDVTICECGYTKEQHESDPDYKLNKMLHGSRHALDEVDGGDASAEVENIPWEFEKDIKSFHCNACYGSIKFVGGHKNMSKYCRIPWDVAHPKLVVDYLVEYENVAPPNLIISIVGGAKNFKLDKWSGRWKRIINEGIIKVGKQAGAWLITGGSNVGVMRAVGEAVEAAQTKQWVDNKRLKDVHCIGIASWGYTANNDQLFLNEKDNKGKVKCGVVQYESSHMIPGKGKPVHLNPNHTHFLLVDDGSQGYGGGKEEGEYKFRAKFEEYISATHSQEYIDYETPAVMLVVGAQGMGSIEQAVGALEMGIPVVICINTGAATNLVEAAVKMSNNPKLSYEVDIAPHMEEELKKAYKYKMSNIEQTIRCHMGFIKSVIEHKKIVSFFDFQQSDELDKAIYTALFDADLDDTSIEKSVIQERKLNFAYDWNRLDIAEKIIVNGDLKLKALHELMSDALIENKPEFVEKLFQHDFNLGDYLSVKTLEELYNEETPISYLFKALIKIKGEPANSFLGIYTKQKIGDEEVWFTMQDVKKLVEMMTGYPYEYNRERKPEDVEDKLDHPYMDLFIWAVLSARQKMALQIWEYTPNAISNAMLACHLYRYFRDNIPLEDTLSKEIYSKYAEEFEERASALLTQCYKTDPNYAQAIVEERHFRWGKLNTLNMAAASDSKNFISHPCCQMALGGEWKRGLLNPGWQIVLFLFLPFLIPTKLVQFMEDVNKLIRENKLDNYKKEYQADVNCCIMGFKKWYKFYQTPFVKFTGHAICHVGFIILMSFFILFDVNPYTPSFTEYLIFGWIATLVGEEIRQIATSYAQGFKGKMTRWFFDPWNIMDLLALLLFLLGFSLRVTIVIDPGNVNHELIVNVMRTSYCLSCLVWYMRILN